MASFAEITQSKAWKNFMAKLYGLGAAVVIVGAMFKIMHWPGAGVMLVTGLSTEAVIFFFSAFEPPHEDPDWSLVYPELAGMHGEGGEEQHAAIEEKGSLTEQLDTMMEEAKIEPEMIERLGAGLRSFGDAATKISDITDATAATNEYVQNVRTAASNVNELSDSYSRASQSLTSLAGSAADSANYAEGLQKVSVSLTELNDVYQRQIQETSSQLDASNKYKESISELMASLSDSLDDTKQFKEEVSKLTQNLSTLNTIYGNMLTAMSVNR
ncbi:MAG: gliding motility protein GldL [Flavobacteriales bacterium]|nr:gliding motility protein GldL [Flavobacteriales bacterium]MCB9449445.1 gliding motility protein GldL [Flavobacteriales bacterium]